MCPQHKPEDLAGYKRMNPACFQLQKQVTKNGLCPGKEKQHFVNEAHQFMIVQQNYKKLPAKSMTTFPASDSPEYKNKNLV